MLQPRAAGALVGGLALSPFHLQAHLGGPDHVHGHADYEYEMGHGRHVDVELHHLRPGEHVNVYLHGGRLGTAIANRHGVIDRDFRTSMGCRAGQTIRVWHSHHLVASRTFRVVHDT